MACRYDEYIPDEAEKELSKIYQLLDELEGKPLPKGYPNHLDNRAIRPSRMKMDEKTAELCSKLQKLDTNKQSLEMQLWWRDHQRADIQRLEKELKDKKEEEDRKKALTKLSDYEKKLLGLK